jgi:uncharacterized membrane protein YraQ (UPF0718 family)
VTVLATIGNSLAQAWWMFYDTLWALALGFALSGAVQAFVSRARMQAALGNHRPRTVAKASVLGMVSSSCSYAASALAKSLFVRGADFTTSMAFMFASTNLVVELGVVLWLLIGWQFALAEFVGGAIMIVLLMLAVPRLVSGKQLQDARVRLQTADGSDVHDTSDDGPREHEAPARRIGTRAGWADAAGYTVSDLTMLRSELLIGFVVAGFAAVAVPDSWWQRLFLTGHGWVSAVENAILGPVLAFLSFVCSVGNVPLAAALWSGGIGFGGVIAFVFADLLAAPLVFIYRKFYGTALTVRLVLVFWAVISVAGLITQGLFQALSLVPARHAGAIADVHVGANYTTVLNIAALVGFGWLYWLYRSRDRLGGGAGLAKDPVCGMQVRTADAPARVRHQGHTVFFCSDRCRDRFTADPGAFTDTADPAADIPAHQDGHHDHSGHHDDGGQGVESTAVDPVCAMTVEKDHAAATASQRGQQFWFCSTGCRDVFVAEADAGADAGQGSDSDIRSSR